MSKQEHVIDCRIYLPHCFVRPYRWTTSFFIRGQFGYLIVRDVFTHMTFTTSILSAAVYQTTLHLSHFLLKEPCELILSYMYMYTRVYKSTQGAITIVYLAHLNHSTPSWCFNPTYTNKKEMILSPFLFPYFIR